MKYKCISQVALVRPSQGQWWHWGADKSLHFLVVDILVSPVNRFIARVRAWNEKTSQDADIHDTLGILTGKAADTWETHLIAML